MKIGLIEADETRIILGIGDLNGDILTRLRIDTSIPSITIPKIIDFFAEKRIEALGIGFFGSLDLDCDSQTYGCITSSRIKEWVNFNIVKELKFNLNVPVVISSSVNCIALGEIVWGNASDVDSVLCVTKHGYLKASMIVSTREIKSNIDEFIIGNSETLVKGFRKIEVQNFHYKNMQSFIAFLVDFILNLAPQKIIILDHIYEDEDYLSFLKFEVSKELSYYGYELPLDIDSYITQPYLSCNAGILGALIMGLNHIL